MRRFCDLFVLAFGLPKGINSVAARLVFFWPLLFSGLRRIRSVIPGLPVEKGLTASLRDLFFPGPSIFSGLRRIRSVIPGLPVEKGLTASLRDLFFPGLPAGSLQSPSCKTIHASHFCPNARKPPTEQARVGFGHSDKPPWRQRSFFKTVYCGGKGIRTLDTLLRYTHFPGVLLRPLGHSSLLCRMQADRAIGAGCQLFACGESPPAEAKEPPLRAVFMR